MHIKKRQKTTVESQLMSLKTIACVTSKKPPQASGVIKNCPKLDQAESQDSYLTLKVSRSGNTDQPLATCSANPTSMINQSHWYICKNLLQNLIQAITQSLPTFIKTASVSREGSREAEDRPVAVIISLPLYLRRCLFDIGVWQRWDTSCSGAEGVGSSLCSHNSLTREFTSQTFATHVHWLQHRWHLKGKICPPPPLLCVSALLDSLLPKVKCIWE